MTFPVSLILAPTTPFKTLRPRVYTSNTLDRGRSFRAPVEPTRAVWHGNSVTYPEYNEDDPLRLERHQRLVKSILDALTALGVQ